MTIKELLRARRLASVRARKADTPKRREIEFDLISAIAKKLRRIRKRDDASGAGEPATKAEAERFKLS
ncbi:hypothetical protein [Erythrobacter rubeus]|uniref:Uncharacterized protein n=1 Tax=Erythrobacter rubeus TaxID=2760803 RepID=A0ABR8KPH2_9SPHN|nr:hypothetical protein [Erythrobacter rubeus]MBD2840888.1 hypothetical protein [Erythrobacter rubeus]